MVVRPASTVRLSLLTLVAAAALSTPARAYVRSRTDGGIPKYWQTSCISIVIYQNSFTDMTRDEVAKSIAAAAHAWSPTAVTCPDGASHPFIEIVPAIAPETELPPTPAYDGHNTLLFYTYARPYPPAEVSGISASVIALTATWARADGHIVDADVRINALDNFFANIDPGGTGGNGQTLYDLQNAITHEFGHLIGLGHTCWSPFSDPDQPINDQGVGVPYCSAAPEDIEQTVMFAMINGDNEITKRTLSPDDVRAVCEVYPQDQDPHVCSLDMPEDGCGCAAASGTAGGTALASIAALVLIAIGVARRRARR